MLNKALSMYMSMSSLLCVFTFIHMSIYISFISKIWKISKHLHAVTVQYHESDNEQLQDKYSNLD